MNKSSINDISFKPNIIFIHLMTVKQCSEIYDFDEFKDITKCSDNYVFLNLIFKMSFGLFDQFFILLSLSTFFRLG